MERVVSKHLFNQKLNGVVDPGTVERAAAAEGNEQWEKLTALADPALSIDEWTKGSRKLMDFLFGMLGQHPELAEASNACIHSKFEVPPRDGNDANVTVLVHTPKTLETAKGKAAVIYAHGGGAISGTAEMFQPWLSKYAVTCNVVYFNVDYRLAPETKCPKNVLDFYCAIKHIIEHASEYGVDSEKIAIAGDSGGGYITFGAMVMLAQRDEGHLIKLAIPAVAMMDDYEFGDPNSMTKEEKDNAPMMKKAWECIATDLEAQRLAGDPLLFPAKASDELIAKFPPVIIWECEFDFFITAAFRMAMRLRRAGRLLEFYIMPGAVHGAEAEPGTELFQQSLRDMKLALDNYLH